MWPTPAPRESHRHPRPCVAAAGGDRPRSESDRFMVPMHAEKRKGVTHEPEQGRQVLDCASPLALSQAVHAMKSGRGLPHSTTLPRPTLAAWGEGKAL